MAFNYQNLLLEKEIQYSEFEKQYILLKDFSKRQLNNYRYFKRKINISTLEKLNLGNKLLITSKQINRNFNDIEKLLFVLNVTFDDEKKFIDTLINKYNIEITNCYELKDILNTLDKTDGEFLNSTIEALVNNYLQNWNLAIEYYGIQKNEDIVLAKLLEIMYLRPELLEKENRKIV